MAFPDPVRRESLLLAERLRANWSSLSDPAKAAGVADPKP